VLACLNAAGPDRRLRVEPRSVAPIRLRHGVRRRSPPQPSRWMKVAPDIENWCQFYPTMTRRRPCLITYPCRSGGIARPLKRLVFELHRIHEAHFFHAVVLS
jgi:hypothetical protein